VDAFYAMNIYGWKGINLVARQQWHPNPSLATAQYQYVLLRDNAVSVLQLYYQRATLADHADTSFRALFHTNIP
jgi:hypothetical protein